MNIALKVSDMLSLYVLSIHVLGGGGNVCGSVMDEPLLKCGHPVS